MSKDEALKMIEEAVKALQDVGGELFDESYEKVMSKLQACKEALEQPAPSWQGLSEHEINNIGVDCQQNNDVDLWKFARAIEQALKEKNVRG